MPIAELLPSFWRIQTSLARSVAEMQRLAPLDERRLSQTPDEERIVVDAFLKRFENGVEAGRRLFRGALFFIGEDDPTMSVRDVQNKAEKFGLLQSADAWRRAVDARNVTTHECGMTYQDAAQALNAATSQGEYVAQALEAALSALHRPPFVDALREAAEQ